MVMFVVILFALHPAVFVGDLFWILHGVAVAHGVESRFIGFVRHFLISV